MKSIKKISLIVFMVVSVLGANSQNNRDLGGKIRQRFTQIKINEIGRKLNLPPDRLEKLRPVYIRYDAEKMASRSRFAKGLMRTNADSLSEEEADRFVKEQLSNAKKLIEIREKYYGDFRQVLSAREILKMFQCENEIQRKVAGEIKRRAARFRDNQ